MNIFNALADTTRRDILEMLARRGKLSASDIFDKFSISPPAISQHLRVLREAKLVDVEKKAQQRIYTINPHSINEVEEWAKKMTKVWNKRFDRLDILLKKEVKKHGRK